METEQQNVLEMQYETYMNVDTGELQEGVLISKEEYEKRVEAQVNKAEYLAYVKNKNEFEQYISCNYGSFYFNNYMNLLKKLNGNTALLFRFLYLCTYADYDGYLKFGSVKNGVHTAYMTEKDFSEVFEMSKSMITKLKQELYDNELIIKGTDNRLMVNRMFYVRGQLTKTDKCESSRVFDYGIRTIYKQSKPKEHKRIGIVIPLLPYLNVYLNVICKNVYEKDPKHMKPLTMEEICDVVGFDYEHASKLKNSLENVTVNGNPLVARISHNNGKFFIVNPAIFYKGNNVEDLKSIVDIFNLRNK